MTRIRITPPIDYVLTKHQWKSWLLRLRFSAQQRSRDYAYKRELENIWKRITEEMSPEKMRFSKFRSRLILEVGVGHTSNFYFGTHTEVTITDNLNIKVFNIKV